MNMQGDRLERRKGGKWRRIPGVGGVEMRQQ